MNTKIIYLNILMIILFNNLIFAEKFTANNPIMKLHNKENKIEVIIRLQPFSENDAIKKGYWGMLMEDYKYVLKYYKIHVHKIVSIQIKRDNKEIFVPISAYMDLSNVYEVKLIIQDKNSFYIYIIGGDAAAAYDAYIYIKGYEVIKRKVVDGEMPDDLWEETIYSWVPDDGR